MKKLIPALILLLVSAMVLSTSSYAWFSMNRTVSATGMQLTSTAPANLLITNGAATPVWGATTISNEDYTNGKIFPASTVDGLIFFALADGQKIGLGDIGGVVAPGTTTDGVVFYKGSDEYAVDDENAPVKVLAVGNTERTGYWAEYTLKLKTTGSSPLDVYLSKIDITTTSTAVILTEETDVTGLGYYSDAACTTSVTGTQLAGTYYTKNTIDDCVRVAIFNITDTNDDDVLENPSTTNLVGIYDAGATNDELNPITNVDYEGDTFTSYTANNGDSDYRIESTAGVYNYSTTAGSESNIFTVEGDETVTTLLVRVWIEGQNTNCKNNISGQGFNIGLTFNIAVA